MYKAHNFRDLPKWAQNMSDNETPFQCIKMGGYEIRLYWTRGDLPQVGAIVWGPYDTETESCLVGYYKTGGGGYCKKSAAFGSVCHGLGIKPKGVYLGGDEIPWRYKVGGNFYRVPKKDIRKV